VQLMVESMHERSNGSTSRGVTFLDDTKTINDEKHSYGRRACLRIHANACMYVLYQ